MNLGYRGLARTKIKPVKVIAAAARRAHREGKVVVSTNGCFDLIHVGHIRNLECAKALGDMLIVGVNSDRSVKRNKGINRPVVSQAERAEVIAALQAVDFVLIFDSKTPIPWLRKIKPSVHVKGNDRTLAELPEAEIIEKYGGVIRLLPCLKGRSTSALIEKAARAVVGKLNNDTGY